MQSGKLIRDFQERKEYANWLSQFSATNIGNLVARVEGKDQLPRKKCWIRNSQQLRYWLENQESFQKLLQVVSPIIQPVFKEAVWSCSLKELLEGETDWLFFKNLALRKQAQEQLEKTISWLNFSIAASLIFLIDRWCPIHPLWKST